MAGNLDSYTQVVRRFQDMACGYAYAILGDFHLAEDFAQEAFIEAYRKLASLRKPEAFPGWFRTIVFKHCDRITRAKNINTTPLDNTPDVASTTSDPSQVAERRELADRVLAAIKTLPEHERTVTALFYMNGYSQDEVAEFLEVPVSTVKTRLYAARQQLRQRMLEMVEATLKANSPDDRFSGQVIQGLLARPRPLGIEGHPIRAIWETIQAALADFEIIEADTNEIEDIEIAKSLNPDNLSQTYHLNDKQVLRTQTTASLWLVMGGRTPPVKLLAAGRVFRAADEDATHLKVFHQGELVCIDAGVDLQFMKTSLERLLKVLFGDTEIRWETADF